MDAQRNDEWLALIHDQQAKLATEAVKEVTRLRARVRQLEAEKAAMPADLWWAQERITMLETQVVDLKATQQRQGEGE